MTAPAFRFIDLFAGVGGFHAALSALGGECVYAVEVDKKAAAVYERNWGRDPLGDITKDANDDVMNVPAHEVLAAGFPCQPFSKSGAQRGMDETRGTLYWNILRIIQERRPKVVLLENVRNLAGPRHVHEWQVIVETLRDEGYRVSEVPAVFSPHLLPPERGGRPQVRERVFITATHDPDGLTGGLDVEPPIITGQPVDGWEPGTWHLEDLLDEAHNIPGCDLTDSERHWIDAWDEFVQTWFERTAGRRPPGMPIWADAWSDVWNAKSAMRRAFGPNPDYRELMEADPSLPQWKAGHLAKNYALFIEHEDWIKPWTRKWGIYTDKFPASRRKLEWQAQDTPRLWDTVMQLRPVRHPSQAPHLPSGARCDHPDLNRWTSRAATLTQGDRAHAGPSWVVRLRDSATCRQYKQMGNGVNVGAVWHVLREHVLRDEDLLKRSAPGRRILDAVVTAPLSPDAVLSARH